MAPNCRANPIKKIHALTRLCLSKLAHFEPGEGFCRCGVDPMGITDIVQVSRTWRDVPVFFAATQLCSEDYSVGIAVSTEFGASWCKAFWSNGSKLFQLPSGAPDLGCQ